MNPKRKKVQEYIINSIKKIDPDNAKRYQKIFNSWSDQQFDKFMKSLKSHQSQISIYMPNIKKSITNEKLFKLAKSFKIQLRDKVRFKNHISNTYFFSKHEFMILKLPVRRVKQYLFDKIRLPESDKHISKLSGQVMKPDKGSKISLIETYLLASKGFEQSILELIKLRGGDLQSYYQLKSKLLENGSVSLTDINELNKSKPKSVIVLASYLKAIHIDIGLTKYNNT